MITAQIAYQDENPLAVNESREKFVERRRQPRLRTIWSGGIKFSDMEKAIPCQVLDISLTGARIKPSVRILGRSLFRRTITLELNGVTTLRAWPVWTRKDQVGLRFLGNANGKHLVRLISRQNAAAQNRILRSERSFHS